MENGPENTRVLPSRVNFFTKLNEMNSLEMWFRSKKWKRISPVDLVLISYDHEDTVTKVTVDSEQVCKIQPKS